jgi:hypothetical protein
MISKITKDERTQASAPRSSVVIKDEKGEESGSSSTETSGK